MGQAISPSTWARTRPVTITLTNANGTLNSLASAINAQNIGVTASVITDANGYRLALVSNTTGSAGNFTITNNSTDLEFHTSRQRRECVAYRGWCADKFGQQYRYAG